MTRSRFRVLILLAAVAGLGLVLFACFDGLWIPNRPGIREYPIRGIDVSRHQGAVDWNAVAASGIRFAYLKATEGGDFQDPSFTENLAGARKAGLDCGAYHFFSLRTPGLVQAQNFIKTVPKNQCTLPCAIDLEYTGNSSIRPTVPDFRQQLDAFVAAVRGKYGVEPVFYVDDALAKDYLAGYPIQRRWVRAIAFGPGSNWIFWQFSEFGRVPGVRGDVDMDVFKGNAVEFDALRNLTR